MSHKFSDFNDLMLAEGLEAVHEQIMHPERFKPEGEITPIVAKGKPSEESIAKALTSEFKDRIIREDEDLFLYKQTHWEQCKPSDLTSIRNMIRACAPGKLTSREVDSAFRTFRDHVPHVPKFVSLFTPNPLIATFQNGSLHLHRNSDHSYQVDFRKHSKDDFVTSCLPFDYLPESDERNEEFEAMLLRIWEGDPDRDDKIKLLGEIYGAMLIGAFPLISIFVGKPGTGKSTLLLLASKLVAEQNLCSVDPTHFNDFNMETMPGKLVNIVTDLSTSRFISDEVVKQICDRTKFRIRRKRLKDILAYIPAIHLWACNKLPKSLEGDTNAFGRRFIIIETNRFQPVGLYNKEFHAYVYEKSPQGLANFAVKGLLRLIANKGHYTKPGSSDAKMREWSEESDAAGAFLADIDRGEMIFDDGYQLKRVKGTEECRLTKLQLWGNFCQWHENTRGRKATIGRNKFYDRMEKEGHPTGRVGLLRGFCGFELVKVGSLAKSEVGP